MIAQLEKTEDLENIQVNDRRELLEIFCNRYNLNYAQLACALGKGEGAIYKYFSCSPNRRSRRRIPDSVVMRIYDLDKLWKLEGKPSLRILQV